LMAGVGPGAFEVPIALVDGETVAAALAVDREGDCGIYNVGTMPEARCRGFGTALTALQLHDARERGCTTASLQATEMAEGIDARMGFRDRGRLIEFAAGPRNTKAPWREGAFAVAGAGFEPATFGL